MSFSVRLTSLSMIISRSIHAAVDSDSSLVTKWNVKASSAFRNLRCFVNSYDSPMNIISVSLNSHRKTSVVLLTRFKYFAISHKDNSQNIMKNNMH